MQGLRANKRPFSLDQCYLYTRFTRKEVDYRSSDSRPSNSLSCPLRGLVHVARAFFFEEGRFWREKANPSYQFVLRKRQVPCLILLPKRLRSNRLKVDAPLHMWVLPPMYPWGKNKLGPVNEQREWYAFHCTRQYYVQRFFFPFFRNYRRDQHVKIYFFLNRDPWQNLGKDQDFFLFG